MTLGDWLLWLVYFFFMVIYFMMVFRIIGDLFRRDDLGGWGKAGWIVLLFVFTLLALLIYVITQGQKMAQRDAQQYGAMRAQQDDYIRSMAASADPTTQIKQAHDLLQSGALTQAEFDAIKTKAMA